MDILEELKTKENESMSPKPRRVSTDEQKVEAVRIVAQSGKLISQIAQEMRLSESALRNWVKQSQIDQTAASNGALSTEERQDLVKLRRDNKRL
jgi:transposase